MHVQERTEFMIAEYPLPDWNLTKQKDQEARLARNGVEIVRYAACLATGELVGMGDLWMYRATDTDTDVYGHLANFVVRRDMRNKDIGKELLRQRLAHGRNMGMTTCYAVLESTNTLYREYMAQGFVDRGTRKFGKNQVSKTVVTLGDRPTHLGVEEITIGLWDPDHMSNR